MKFRLGCAHPAVDQDEPVAREGAGTRTGGAQQAGVVAVDGRCWVWPGGRGRVRLRAVEAGKGAQGKAAAKVKQRRCNERGREADQRGEWGRHGAAK